MFAKNASFYLRAPFENYRKTFVEKNLRRFKASLHPSISLLTIQVWLNAEGRFLFVKSYINFWQSNVIRSSTDSQRRIQKLAQGGGGRSRILRVFLPFLDLLTKCRASPWIRQWLAELLIYWKVGDLGSKALHTIRLVFFCVNIKGSRKKKCYSLKGTVHDRF